MSPDEQEALSRRFGDDIIILLPLRSGKIAVFNAARTLCGIRDQVWLDTNMKTPDCWYAPAKPPKGADFSLEDLGL